jgi:hypothetical protein
MKRKSSGLAEVQVDRAQSPASSCISLPAGSRPSFLVHLPGGATVAVPAGFDANELLVLLTLVREASQ